MLQFVSVNNHNHVPESLALSEKNFSRSETPKVLYTKGQTFSNINYYDFKQIQTATEVIA